MQRCRVFDAYLKLMGSDGLNRVLPWHPFQCTPCKPEDRQNAKGDGQKGTAKKTVINCPKLSQHVSWHFYDNLWRLMTIDDVFFLSVEQREENCHKMSQIVVQCCKLLWCLSQIVVTFLGIKLFCLQLEAFNLQLEPFCLQLTFLAYSGKVLLISSSTDCKQRGSTVSKKAPTVRKKELPLFCRPLPREASTLIFKIQPCNVERIFKIRVLASLGLAWLSPIKLMIWRAPQDFHGTDLTKSGANPIDSIHVPPHLPGPNISQDMHKYWFGWNTMSVMASLGTDPPDLTPESASPSGPRGSIWHQFDFNSTSISWFEPILMRNRPLRTRGRGGFEGGVRGACA